MIQSVAMNQANGFWVNTKRTLFMATLYFRLIRNYNPDDSDTVLEECNRLFYLVNNTNSLILPMLMCRRVWKDKTVQQVVDFHLQGREKQAVEAIYGQTPKWLRYIDRETMIRDTAKVLRQAEQAHGFA
jgi:hypothetical protein